MSDAQEIFRRVIDAGLYHGDAMGSREFMCHALGHACRYGIIDRDEYDLAKQEIEDCIDRSGADCISMGTMMKMRLPDMYRNDGNYTHIYYHWNEHRPF